MERFKRTNIIYSGYIWSEKLPNFAVTHNTPDSEVDWQPTVVPMTTLTSLLGEIALSTQN